METYIDTDLLEDVALCPELPIATRAEACRDLYRVIGEDVPEEDDAYLVAFTEWEYGTYCWHLWD